MMLRISESFDTREGSATLRLEGVMSAKEAAMLEGHCDELAGHAIRSITLDLEGLTFLDDEGGATLRRLRTTRGVTLTGCRLFIHEVVEGNHTFNS
jgi:anti-anti-sigma regulatory factor